MKIVLNKCFGGYGISDKFPALKGRARDDATLVECVERNSEAVSGPHARLKVVEIPDNFTDYEIEEYDGLESVVYVVNGKLHWV